MLYPVVNIIQTKGLGDLQPLRLKVHPGIGQATATGTGLTLPKDLTEDQIYKIAGQTMVSSGEKLAAKMNQVYEKYKGTGSWWLAEAATAFFVGGPVGPVYAAADLWWQGNRNREALVALEASRRLGQEWVNQMTQDETGWLPLYLDGVEKVDPVLAEQVGYTFDKVGYQIVRTSDLLKGVRELPPQVIAQFVNTVFGETKAALITAANTMNDLAVTLRNLLGAVSDTAKGLRQMSEYAPLAVLALVAAGIGAFALN